tara:strand:+ start:1293 stop:1463 length:171 start_codon:yes stop_codon:yes gene_type:complete
LLPIFGAPLKPDTPPDDDDDDDDDDVLVVDRSSATNENDKNQRADDGNGRGFREEL